MSNSSGSKRKPKKPKNPGASPFDEKESASHKHDTSKTDSSKLKRWSFIQNDLEKALDTWEELENSQVTMSPEEEQLEKIKTIIGQLKDKLNQF
jgi:hypothetical protein